MEKLLKRVNDLDEDERTKLKQYLRESKDGSGSKGEMDWMYKSGKADSEEYLLGKKVDKIEDEEEDEAAQKAKADAPGAAFAEVIARRQDIDMKAKMREDPLYQIRQREEDSKKRLLQNPIRMKQLQKMLEDKQKKEKKRKKEKKKHKKKDRSNSSADSDDEILNKYLAIVKEKKSEGSKNGAKSSRHSDRGREERITKRDSSDQLSSPERSKDSVRKKEKSKQRHSKHNRSPSSSDDSSPDRSRSQKHSDHRSTKHSISSHKRAKHSSDSEGEQQSSKGKKYYSPEKSRNSGKSHKHKRSKDSPDRSLKRSKDSQERSHKRSKDSPDRSHKRSKDSQERSHKRSKDSPESPKESPPKRVGGGLVFPKSKDRRNSSGDDQPKQYGLIGGKVRSEDRSHRRRRSVSPAKVQTKKRERTPPRKKLSQEEMDQRRRAMMENASWRDEQREKNVKKYREEDSKDEESKVTESKDFIHSMMRKHTEESSVQDRIKRNIYNIQRTHTQLDKKFTHK